MIKLKKYIPQCFKFPLWYLFKSPQRKINPFTLIYDITGIFLTVILSFFRFYRLKPISICVGIYNRSEIFLKHFVPTLANAKYQQKIELSVFDCGSNDVEDLKLAIESIYKGKLTFNQQQVAFSRSYTFNKAVMQSSYNKVFICDADFSIPKNIVDLVNRYTLKKCVWFPIVFYLYKNKPNFYAKQNGEWMQWGGKGIVACNKKDFYKIGMLNEKFKTWGYEDEDLWARFHKNHYIIIRTRCKELLHHWHKSHNPKYQLLENK